MKFVIKFKNHIIITSGSVDEKGKLIREVDHTCFSLYKGYSLHSNSKQTLSLYLNYVKLACKEHFMKRISVFTVSSLKHVSFKKKKKEKKVFFFSDLQHHFNITFSDPVSD